MVKDLLHRGQVRCHPKKEKKRKEKKKYQSWGVAPSGCARLPRSLAPASLSCRPPSCRPPLPTQLVLTNGAGLGGPSGKKARAFKAWQKAALENKRAGFRLLLKTKRSGKASLPCNGMSNSMGQDERSSCWGGLVGSGPKGWSSIIPSNPCGFEEDGSVYSGGDIEA